MSRDGSARRFRPGAAFRGSKTCPHTSWGLLHTDTTSARIPRRHVTNLSHAYTTWQLWTPHSSTAACHVPVLRSGLVLPLRGLGACHTRHEVYSTQTSFLDKPATPWLRASCRSCAAASSHRFAGSARATRAAGSTPRRHHEAKPSSLSAGF